MIKMNGVNYRWSTGSSGDDLPKVNRSIFFSGGFRPFFFFLPITDAPPQLGTNNRKKKLVAGLHKARHFVRRRRAYLEIAPAGLTMLDQIVVSLVYVEKKRREKQDFDDDWGDKDGGDSGGGDGGGSDGGGGGGGN